MTNSAYENIYFLHKFVFDPTLSFMKGAGSLLFERIGAGSLLLLLLGTVNRDAQAIM